MPKNPSVTLGYAPALASATYIMLSAFFYLRKQGCEQSKRYALPPLRRHCGRLRLQPQQHLWLFEKT